MATTCNFGQIKDLRLRSLCMGDLTIIDINQNIKGNNLTTTGNTITCNITAKDITASGNIRGNNIISSCITSNSIKVGLNNGELFNVPQNQNVIVEWDALEYGYTPGDGTTWNGNSRINVFKDGIYHVEATVDWEAFPEGQRNLFTLVNGNIAGSADIIPSITSNINVVQNCSCDIALRKDDYVQLQVFQDAASTLGINVYNLSNLSVRYIHEITPNTGPLLFSVSKSKSLQDPEVLELQRELQELRKQIKRNTNTHNRNQRLRPFGNNNLARNRLM
jgi:hypothetical protein